MPVDMEGGWTESGTDEDGPSTVVGVMVTRLSAILSHYDNFAAQEQAGGCSEGIVKAASSCSPIVGKDESQ